MIFTKSEMTITKAFLNINSLKGITGNNFTYILDKFSEILNVKDATGKEINKVNKT